MRRQRASLVAAAAVVAAAVVPVTAVGATGALSHRPAIAWGACQINVPFPTDPAVQCATLPLPVDWAKPAGATFDLAVARRLSRSSWNFGGGPVVIRRR